MKKQFIVALVGASFAFAAQAENTYVGASVGQGKQKIEVGSDSVKESATGYKLFGGYNFDKNFGAEAGYVDFGTAKFTGPNGHVESKTKSFYVAATGTLPVNEEFAVFAKAGVAANKVNLDATVGKLTVSDSANRSSLVLGLGASYSFTKTLAIVAEYENFGKVATGDNINVKADMFSVGLRYKF